MIKVEATVRGVAEAVAVTRKTYRDADKAYETALKVEAFRLLKVLRKDVKAGTPGGRAYSQQRLSAIASYTKRGAKKKSDIALSRMARLLRYEVDTHGGAKAIDVRFGFTGHGASRLSRSYKDILIANQEGLDVLYTGSRTELGKRLARIGGRLKKEGNPDARFFFLRKDTGRKVDLPQRDIMRTFWAAHRNEAMANVRKNFRAKLAGKRI